MLVNISCWAQKKEFAERGIEVFTGRIEGGVLNTGVKTLEGSMLKGKNFPMFKPIPSLKNAYSMQPLLMNPPKVYETPVTIEVHVPAQKGNDFVRSLDAPVEVITQKIPTHIVKFVDDFAGRSEAMARLINQGIVGLQAEEMRPALMDMQENAQWKRGSEAAYKGYMKQEYPSLFKRTFNKKEAQADKKAFSEDVAFYSNTMDEISAFIGDLTDLTTRLSQHMNIGAQEIATMQRKFSRLANKIIELDQRLAIRPWELVHNVQDLQRAEFFLERLREGTYPNRLPRPILPLSSSVNTFYLGNRDLVLMREYIPLNLRIAVVHGREDVREMIVHGGKEASRLGYNWKVDSFESPQQFLKQNDLISYDIVIGDFSPYANEYTNLLKKLVYIRNGGLVILSASNTRPDRSYYPTDAESKSNWDNFAKRSIAAGIDGNLQFFPEASLANEYAKNAFTQYSPAQIMNNITHLYGAKGSKE